jgi:hypothetical protein
LYITTVLLQHQQLVRTVGSFALQYAALCSSISKELLADTSDYAAQKRFPAWFSKQRPESAMGKLEINWHVPLTDIKQAVEQLQPGARVKRTPVQNISLARPQLQA